MRLPPAPPENSHSSSMPFIVGEKVDPRGSFQLPRRRNVAAGHRDSAQFVRIPIRIRLMSSESQGPRRPFQLSFRHHALCSSPSCLPRIAVAFRGPNLFRIALTGDHPWIRRCHVKGPTVALASMLVGIAVATLSHHAERTPASAWARPALRQISTSDVSFIHTPAGHQSCLERVVFGDPSESQYALPYPVGRTYQVLQSCCSTTPGRSHYGLLAYDFTMEMGSEVVAARDGVVWIVRDIFPDDGISSPNDNNIYVVHLDGQTSLYAHLQKGSPLVKPGDEVVAGQVIARAGSSGTWVPCPACAVLHFEVFPRMAYEPWRDLPVNFRNAGGPLNERGTLIEGVPYTALPY